MNVAVIALLTTAITGIVTPIIGIYAARRSIINKQRADDAEKSRQVAQEEADSQRRERANIVTEYKALLAIKNDELERLQHENGALRTRIEQLEGRHP